MYRAILFDLDGTLVDSEGDIAASVNHVRAKAGLTPAPLEDVRAAIGDGVKVLLERMLPSPGPDDAAAYVEHQEAHCLDTTRLYPGVREGLEVLARRADLAVVSNKPTFLCVKILTGLGVLPWFKAVLGGDTPAGRKPAPGPILRALDALQRPPWDAVALGDSPGDLTAARAAECASAAALWGYRPAALLEAEAPDASYADFASFAAEMARLPVNVYTALSRDAFFDLARAFYARVDRDPRLRAMFPPSLEAAAERQALFLIQFFGGPAEYSEKRGAPRLRMRHAEFPIDAAAADAWLENMRAAVRQVGIEGPARGILERYLTHTARMLVNRR